MLLCRQVKNYASSGLAKGSAHFDLTSQNLSVRELNAALIIQCSMIILRSIWLKFDFAQKANFAPQHFRIASKIRAPHVLGTFSIEGILILFARF